MANPKSCHIFTFPFKWDFKPKGKTLDDTGFYKRTCLENFHNILSHADWEETLFEINDFPGFNEYIYFYDFARDALFPNPKETKTLRQYEYIIKPGSTGI